jgi:hypothetical protein
VRGGLRRRGQRLAVMTLVAGLALLALVSQPARQDVTLPRPVAIAVPRPEVAVAAVASGAGASTKPVTTSPAEADGDATAEGEVLESPESGTETPEPSGSNAAGPDIVVALQHPVDAALPWVSYAHATESAQPVPVPALPVPGGVMAASDAFGGPEPGARYWFGPEGLVRLQLTTEGQR